MRDFVRIAYDYALDVVAKRIPACTFNVQVAQRFLDDLERDDIVIRHRKAESICLFIERLKHIKGKWAGKRIVLEPWQIFILVNVFGWYWAHDTKKRRFRNVYLEVPRKNAKSTLTSGVGLYLMGLDGEGGAEVYSAATTRDQARIVFQDAKRMVDRDRELRQYTGMGSTAHSVIHEQSSSLFRAVSADAGTLDGLNVHGGLIDELHAHKTRDVLEVLDTGTGARENSIIWTITTAGVDITGVCYERRDYAIKVIRRLVVDESTESFFAMIFTIDEGDDWKSPEVWAKANPNYGVSVNVDDLRRKAKAASETPGKKSNFLTKHLNVWTTSAAAWMDIARWSKCYDETFDPTEFGPDPCWVGVDLASRKDIAAVQYLFRRGTRWYTFGKYYIPKNRLEEEGNSQYKAWVEEGHLIATEGDVIDFNKIQEDLIESCKDFDVQNVGYDPFQATKFMTELADLSITITEIKQTYALMNEPMKELESEIIKQGISHDGNPAMTWMIGNVVEKRSGDMVRPTREMDSKKIDGPVALINALAVALRDEINGTGSIYDQRKSLYL